MAKHLLSPEWFKDKVESKAVKTQKETAAYKHVRMLFWLFLSIFVITLSVGVYLNVVCVIQGWGAVALFFSGLFAGLTIDKFRSKRSVLEEAYAQRGNALMELISELHKNGTIDEYKAETCNGIIKDGYSQMQLPSDQGSQALQNVITRIVEQVSK
ncbi:hypothetical protein M1O17_01995 [Dehalococcoidia bacterium]|nr:hypothetical protein [Dehalococcoidia bacterium]